MADLTASEFKARFSEFDSTDDATIKALIEDTLCNFDQGRWDCLYKRGHSLYIAHLLEIRSEQESGNYSSSGMDSTNSESADGVSVGYATMTPENSVQAFFSGTSYGREYLMLLRSVGIGAIAVC